MTLRADDLDNDPFGAFSSELGEGSKPTTVSLDDIVSHGTQIHWDEAVAVVEDLCDRLITAGSDPQIPPLQHILIGADGVVTVKQGPRSERGVQGAARILHALLSTANVPVALRLFITQATSPESFASLRDFASALAYFGKPPLRVELIRALYERHVVGASSAPVRPRDSILRPVDTQPPAQPESKALPRRKLTMRPWVPVAAGVLAFFVAGVWIWFSLGRGRTGADAFREVVSQTKGAINGLSANTGSTEAKPAEDKTRRAVASAPERGSASKEPSVSRARGVTPLVPFENLQLPPPRLEPTTPVAVVALADAQSPDSRASVDAPIVTTADDDRPPIVYSRTDTDVKPPVLVYPQLPAPVPADVRADSINSMEIVVGESGQVEQVRIVAGPRRMPDMMLLSGAKMWRFKPALKDGQPVRYRTVVSWSGLP